MKTATAIIAILAIATIATGCATAQKRQLAATAGHSPVLQIQAGLHVGSSNTRPLQATDAAGAVPERTVDRMTFGDVTITTTVTVSSGEGGVSTEATDSGAQTPTIPIDADVTLTPTP